MTIISVINQYMFICNIIPIIIASEHKNNDPAINLLLFICFLRNLNFSFNDKFTGLCGARRNTIPCKATCYVQINLLTDPSPKIR
jgi:hypothetical protein